MNPQTLIVTLIILFLVGILFTERKRFVIHGYFPIVYVAICRMKFGLNAMNWAATRIPRVLSFFGFLGIITGIIGMLFMTVEIIWSSISFFFWQAPSSVMPVLPVQIPGGLYVPPLIWILVIPIVAIVHEYGHGVIARLHNIPVKSSGFAFIGLLLPIIPAAFVEPDENALKKAKLSQQLSVYAAGPFFNIFFAVLLVFLLGLSIPGIVSHDVTQYTSVYDLGGRVSSLQEIAALNITTITPNSPAETANIQRGTLITAIDNISVNDEAIYNHISTLKPGTNITLTTPNETRTILLGANPTTPERGWIGIQFVPITSVTAQALMTYGERGVALLLALTELLFWLIILSIGIGLFNLLPMGPLDGGRMLKELLEKYVPTYSRPIFTTLGMVLLFVILAQLVVGVIGGLL